MAAEYEIDDPEIKARIKSVGHRIKDEMPDGWGFVLVMASLGEGGATFYLSSIERDSTISLMKELIERLEKGKQHDA